MKEPAKEEAEPRETKDRTAYLASFPQLNPNPVIEVDLFGVISFCNPATERILSELGMDKENVAALLPQDMDRILGSWDRLDETIICRQVTLKSRTFAEWIYLSAQFNSARIYAYEITELKLTEEALAGSEEKYRLLFQNMTEGFALYELLYDDHGKPSDWQVLEINDAYSLHTGIAREQIQGRRVSEVFPAAIPEYLPRFAEVVTNQKAAEFETYAKAADRHLHILCFPAGPNRFANTITDISARKKAEEALRRSEAIYRSIGESIDYGVWVCAPDGRNTYASESFLKMVGITQEQCSNFGWGDVLHPDDAERTITAWQECVRTGGKWDIEHRFRSVDGQWHHVLARGVPVRDEHDKIIAWAGINLDIDRLKQAELKLQTAYDELEDRVRVRTSELSMLNDDLEAEIAERRKAENRLSRINALYSILFRVNEAIVRIHDPERLFEQTCRIVVDSGLFRMAWIGLIDPGTARVRPVASAGDRGRYLDRITIIARDVPEGRGPTGRAITGKKVMVCPDIENDPSMLLWRESALREGFRSSAAFPLHAGSAVVGALTAYADSPHFFTDEELRLLSSLADDISFAIEAMAAEKKRIEAEISLLASSDEIKDLYNNAPCGYHSIDNKGRIVSINDTELSWLGYQRDEVIGRKIEAFHTTESRKRFKLIFPKFLKTGSIREVEFELVRKDGTFLPILLNATAVRDRDNRFVMSRSTVFDITERKSHERKTEAANNVLKLFAITTALPDYLNALAGLLKSWCGCGAAGIRLMGEEGDIPFVAHTGFSKEFLQREGCLSLGKDSCACTRVIDGKPRRVETGFMTRAGSFVCNDTSNLCSKNLRDFYRQACVREGFSSLAVIPIRYRSEVLGALHLADNRKDAFPPQIIDFIESITPLVGEAVHRFGIEEELQASREQLRAFSAHLQSAREEERTKIAREIHDELGQILTAAGMELSLLKKRFKDQPPVRKAASSVIGMLDDAVTDIQKICEELRPRVLDHLGLPAAIKQECTAFTKRTGIPCSLKLADHIPGLHDESAVVLFRIFQEALTNVSRHSGATKISIGLAADRKDIILEVRDNGKGISRKEIGKNTSLGLIGMRERVREINGDVTIQGTAGKGTVVTVRVPSGKRTRKR